MANSDYSIRGSMGAFATVANLAANIGPGEYNLPVNNWKRVIDDVRRVGEGVMIGNEICMLTAWSDTVITVARGCADTIPQGHSAGTPIWFYEEAVGRETEPAERASGTTIGVKILTTTVGGGQLALTNSPPNALALNQRFARPYPPGLVKLNGVPWYDAGGFLSSDSDPIAITWAHRDRKLQANILVWHGEGDVGPEPGTTYTAKIYRSGGTVNLDDFIFVKAYSGITGTSFNYTLAMAVTDLGASFANTCFIELSSVRDGLESWQKYRIVFVAVTSSASYGWGNNFGNTWGGAS